MGDLIVACSNDSDGNVILISAETGCRIGTFHGHDGAVKDVDICRDSSLVVSAGTDSKICFFETRTGKLIFPLNCGGILKSIEFNQAPGRCNLVVSCADKFRSVPNNVSIWHFWDGSDDTQQTCFAPKSTEEVNNFDNFRSQLICEISDNQLPMKVSNVRFGPFDETVLSSHDEGTIYIWTIPSIADAAQGKDKAEMLKCLDAHSQAIKSIQFNTSLPRADPKGERTLMLTTSRDKTAKLWGTQKYDLVKTYNSNRPLNDGCISPLYQLAGPDARHHVIVGGGVEARDVTQTTEGGFESVFFHMVSEEELCKVKGHFGPMNCIAVNPNGRSFCSGGEDGLMRIIHFDPDYFTRRDL